MTFALHLCTGQHVELGVSAWLGVNIVFGVRQYGKSTLWSVFNVCCEDMVNRHCVWCSIVSLVKLDNVQIEAYDCMA